MPTFFIAPRKLPALLALSIVSMTCSNGWSAVTSDTVTADAAKVSADVTLVQADQQSYTAVVVPARTALQTAQKKLETDAAPFEAKLKADEETWKTTLKADEDAIVSARETNAPAVAAAEQKAAVAHLATGKAAAAGAQAADAELRAARTKREDDLKPLREKRSADLAQRDAALEADRSAMKTALAPDVLAVGNATQALEQAGVVITKLEADRIALSTDQQQLKTDEATLQATTK